MDPDGSVRLMTAMLNTRDEVTDERIPIDEYSELDKCNQVALQKLDVTEYYPDSDDELDHPYAGLDSESSFDLGENWVELDEYHREHVARYALHESKYREICDQDEKINDEN